MLRCCPEGRGRGEGERGKESLSFLVDEKIINSSFPFFNNFEENNTLRWSAKDINKIKLPLSTTGGNIDLVILIRICKPQMERKHK